jgi:NADH-quinone oxidoreductase subunit H
MTLDAQTFVSLTTLVGLFGLFLGAVSYIIMLERKVAGWTQDRVGPNRVGFSFGGLFGLWKKLGLNFMNTFHFWGLGQPLADGLKMFVKEDYDPRGVDKALFYLAPVLAVVPAMIGWAVIPFGGTIDFGGFEFAGLRVEPGQAVVSAAPLHVGVIYILAAGSLAVYGVTVGGWASNNKYSFLGGLRATAQMLSYEIPMGLIVLCILLMTGAAAASSIVDQQAGYWFGVIPSWNIVQQPIAALLFFTCLLAENNRTPFDLAECEQELVGGFHTEYSSMKFALFFLGEYLHMVTAMAFFTLMFLGGWHLPFVDYLLYGGAQPAVGGPLEVLLKSGVFIGKMVILIWLVMQIRWTLPRFRFDQLMRLAWRGLIPISLVLLLTTGTMAYFRVTGYLWLANLLIAAGVLVIAPILAAHNPPNKRIPLAGSRFSPLTD